MGEAGGTALPIAFLFSGQGAQYVGMGRKLYEREPVFRRELDRCAALLKDELPRPLLDVLFGDDASQAALDQTGFTQPALFSLQWALAAVWQAWGVRPAWVLGHSVGEYAAAAVAGVFSLEDGLRLIAARGRLMQQLPGGGAMVAVATDQATAVSALEGFEDEVALAAVNAPQQVVLSGTAAAVERVIARLPAGTRAQRLAVSHAFHSPRMRPMLAAFADVAATVTYQPPRCRVIGNRDGQVAGTRSLEPTTGWRRSAVRSASPPGWRRSGRPARGRFWNSARRRRSWGWAAPAWRRTTSRRSGWPACTRSAMTARRCATASRRCMSAARRSTGTR